MCMGNYSITLNSTPTNNLQLSTSVREFHKCILLLPLPAAVALVDKLISTYLFFAPYMIKHFLDSKQLYVMFYNHLNWRGFFIVLHFFLRWKTLSSAAQIIDLSERAIMTDNSPETKAIRSATFFKRWRLSISKNTHNQTIIFGAFQLNSHRLCLINAYF